MKKEDLSHYLLLPGYFPHMKLYNADETSKTHCLQTDSFSRLKKLIFTANCKSHGEQREIAHQYPVFLPHGLF